MKPSSPIKLGNLCTTVTPTTETIVAIERFVCQLHLPKTTFTKVKDLRWWLYISQETSRQKDFLQHSPHCMTGFCLPTIKLRSGTTTEYGWERKEDEWQLVMTQLSPTPEAIIQHVKCNCVKERCSNNRCQCRKSRAQMHRPLYLF